MIVSYVLTLKQIMKNLGHNIDKSVYAFRPIWAFSCACCHYKSKKIHLNSEIYKIKVKDHTINNNNNNKID